MSLSVPHSPAGLQLSLRNLFLLSFRRCPHAPYTSSIAGKEALCAHNGITIAGRNVQNRSTLRCCPSPALVLLGNFLQFGLTRGADQHLPAREPWLDVLPMLRTDGQKTIGAALVCLVIAHITRQRVPCCALSVHRCFSWLTSLWLRSAATCNFTEV